MIKLNKMLLFFIFLSVALSGCSADIKGDSTDYQRLPGSGDTMSHGPGVLDGGHYSESQGGGMLIYSSSEPDKALIRPGQKASSREIDSSLEPSTSPKSQAYQQFQIFEAYQKFKKFPHNAPEREKFRQWQKNQ